MHFTRLSVRFVIYFVADVICFYFGLHVLYRCHIAQISKLLREGLYPYFNLLLCVDIIVCETEHVRSLVACTAAAARGTAILFLSRQGYLCCAAWLP